MTFLILGIFSCVALTFILWNTPTGLLWAIKYSSISTIVDDKDPKNYGEVFYKGQIIKASFFYTTKAKNYSDIKRILAYDTVDFGLENHYKHLEITI